MQCVVHVSHLCITYQFQRMFDGVSYVWQTWPFLCFLAKHGDNVIVQERLLLILPRVWVSIFAPSLDATATYGLSWSSAEIWTCCVSEWGNKGKRKQFAPCQYNVNQEWLSWHLLGPDCEFHSLNRTNGCFNVPIQCIIGLENACIHRALCKMHIETAVLFVNVSVIILCQIMFLRRPGERMSRLIKRRRSCGINGCIFECRRCTYVRYVLL